MSEKSQKEKIKPPHQKPLLSAYKNVFILITVIAFYIGCNRYNGSFDKLDVSLFENADTTTPKCTPIEALTPSFENSSVKEILHDTEFKKRAIHALSGAVQIETEVKDKNPDPKVDPEFWAQFPKFHSFLKKTFPLTFEHLELDRINEFGIVLTWKGSVSDLKPLMFTAHQDVVPANPLTLDEWTHPPYDGVYDSETDILWGRGSFDCKNLLIGELHAVEVLLRDGYKPKRTVLLAFGFDEESSGEHGAGHIGEFLLDKYGKDGVYAIVDEGFGVAQMKDNLYLASPIIAEKGYCDTTFEIKGKGGHSSLPPLSGHTNIGIAAKLISLLEDEPFQPTYTLENPVWHLLSCIAEHSTQLPPKLKDVINQAPQSPKHQQILLQFMLKSLMFKELVKTSQAVDKISGGVKSNALPEQVSFVVNHRIDVGSSVQETIDHDVAAARRIAEQYEYGLKVHDKFLLEETANGFIELSFSKALEPAPISPVDTSVWKTFSQSIQETFVNGVFAASEEPVNFYVTNSVATFNTDTKYYWDLSKNIYRFQAVMFPIHGPNVIHSVNEHIKMSDHLSTIAFIYNYILNVDEYDHTD